ncbi:MAG: hypothetical protein ACKORK_14795, partial [Gemmatimonadota bacterium]
MPDAPSAPQDTLPLLALRSTLVFPRGRIAVQVASDDNQALLAAHPEEGALVCCVLTQEEGPGGEVRAVGRGRGVGHGAFVWRAAHPVGGVRARGPRG